ncbi:LacI family DNA-binding transcriptional regulator [Vibrio sp. ZSDZ65]|uniref:LacI family DNA-binding transcriptional regulator n=1 Tax=Vibrio qingdaonensis TaxID=2829491 RepID=A0A9X3CLM6_9VIBR|nr:LacI family DNA-binding transcriptional regulator [Vibrio qingdaonensis]MCW8345677.1 LacI family DNA-binding transcriptional regulator [Vibrio qingdaonensis]
MAKATIADVAKYCGVSTATVSMVLTNKGRISVTTRERVLEAVKELGYVYNQAAANLRHKRSNLVGLVTPDITNPFFSEMIAGLSHYLEEQDSLLFLANAEESVERQSKFIDSLLSQNAGGVVMCPAMETNLDFLETVQSRGFPIVLAVRPIGEEQFDFVGTNNFMGLQLATEHLIKKGHKHIAFVGGLEISKTRSHRLGGYMSKLMEHGIPFNERYIRSCSASRSEGAKVTKELLDQHPEITAIIGYQDIVAFGVMRAIKDQGKIVGKDIAVVGFDDVAESADTNPALTSISVSAREIGRAAGEIILARMDGDKQPCKSVVFPPKLVVRSSCGEGK